jgi:gliding motility-associated-like protein
MRFYFFFMIIISNAIYSQSDVPLTLRAQFNGTFDYVIIGNTHNEFDNWQVPQPPCKMLTQSTASLNLQPNQNIVAAYLYWSGIGDGTFDTTITFNGIDYQADETFNGFAEPSASVNFYFAAFKDVTKQVVTTGNGIYNFSNFDLNPLVVNYCTVGGLQHAGWHLVVVYNQNNIETKQLNVYDGFSIAFDQFNNGNTPFSINNLNVVATNDAKITFVAYNGSPNFFVSESVSINGNLLSNSLNPPDNPFNGTNSFTGSTTNWNQDIDTFDISPHINIGDIQADIILSSRAFRSIPTLVTSIRSELPDATVQLTQVSGQEICNNRNLQVNFTVQNTNSNAALSANVPVSFYADTMLLSTVNTPSSIAIGGSLPLQTTVNIPLSIPNTFTLRVVVDNDAANASTVAESNENNNESSQSVTFLQNTITPSFSLPNLICKDNPAPVLPTISNNNISGTWLPNMVSNQISGTYVFTPASGQCAVPVSLATTVTVLDIISPIFNLLTSFCFNEIVPVLPTISANGVSGNWSPAVINNQSSGVYIFTPTGGQCGLPFTLNVTILPKVLPAFTLQNSFCAGAMAPVLPLISTNGVSGSWSPAVINNQVSGSYVFTPAIGQCALPFTLAVVISPIVVPEFSLPNTICQNATVPVLQLISNNGISGNWSPSVLNNQNSGNYVFTPNPGECALPFTANVVVQPQISNITDLVLCNDDQGNALRPIDLDSGLNPNDFAFVWTLNNTPIPQNTASISVASAGNYELVATPNAPNCPIFFEFKVLALQPLIATYTVSDDFEPNQTIKVEASGGSGAYSYSFDNAPYQNYPIFTVRHGGEILVKIRDNSSCYEVSKVITLWQYPRFFTPNNDGYNDSWGIKTHQKIIVDIFDRYGKLIIQLQTNERWNGTFNSQSLPADDYWFVLTYNDGQIFKGHFSLKR